VKLNEELNKTYISYGKAAPMAKARQLAQDTNAAAKAESGAQVQRVDQQGQHELLQHRVGSRRCLQGQKDFDITKVKEADLPEEMKKMTVDERKAYLEKKTAERAEIQQKVLTLNKKRESYVATKRKESATTDTLDTAMVKALRTQAEKKGIAWEK
jgi:hypothetical protein